MIFSGLDVQVLLVVERDGDPLMKHIVAALHDHTDRVRCSVSDLVRHGYLRQKEDIVDHEWSYRLTDKGRDRLRRELA